MLVVGLSGCATYPVTGTIGENERFVGIAHSVVIGTSKVEITTEEEAHCIGTYSAPSGAGTSQGSFSCNDGRSGTFAVTGNTVSGGGFGKMNNGDKVKIYYGHVSNVQQF